MISADGFSQLCHFWKCPIFVGKILQLLSNQKWMVITGFVQGLAEIPDDLVIQLWVKPLAWGISPWALFQRGSKHFSWHGALVCRASGFCCGDLCKKTTILSWLREYFVGVSIFIGTSVPSRNTSSSGDISRARYTKRYQGQRWI